MRCLKSLFCVLFQITWMQCLFLLNHGSLVHSFLPSCFSVTKRRRRTSNFKLFAKQNEDYKKISPSSSNRRSMLKYVGLIPFQFASVSALNKEFLQPANARGLVKFPCVDYQFLNSYIFLRAGESLLEEEGVWSTNPLFLTNREAALSANGIEQVEEACLQLKEQGIVPTIVRYSLAAASIDTADIVGKELKVGRNNLVPEFNFMDPRAIGKWDMLPLESTKSAVWAMDVQEAGNYGEGGRPPANEDSTPNETLADQVVRLRQLISVLETQYSGDTILLIFPDGTGPALLQCCIGGIPLNRVHEFEFKSGEARVNVDYDSTRQFLSYTPSEEYLTFIKNGEEELKVLREKGDQILNVREQQYQLEQKLDEERKYKEEQSIQAQREKQAMEKKKVQDEMRTSVGNEEQNKSSAIIAGLTAVGGAGALALFSSDSSNDEEGINITDEGKDNSAEEFNPPESLNESTTSNTSSLLDINKPISLSMSPSGSNQVLNNDRELSEIEDQDAMEQEVVASKFEEKKTKSPEFIDDGADAWLGALSEIMNEQDERDDETNDWQ